MEAEPQRLCRDSVSMEPKLETRSRGGSTWRLQRRYRGAGAVKAVPRRRCCRGGAAEPKPLSQGGAAGAAQRGDGAAKAVLRRCSRGGAGVEAEGAEQRRRLSRSNRTRRLSRGGSIVEAVPQRRFSEDVAAQAQPRRCGREARGRRSCGCITADTVPRTRRHGSSATEVMQ